MFKAVFPTRNQIEPRSFLKKIQNSLVIIWTFVLIPSGLHRSSLSRTETSEDSIDDEVKMLFWVVFAGSKGCINRTKIVLQLKDRPFNANELSVKLGLDYKIIENHLKILKEKNLITAKGNKYGKYYSISPILTSNLEIFNEIISKSEKCKQI